MGCFLALTLLVLSICLFTYRAIRLENLKHELIAAIKANNTPLALKLLDAGADPNATDNNPDDDEEKPSLMDSIGKYIDGVIHPREKMEPVRYPSALLVAVTMQGPKTGGFMGNLTIYPQDPTLVKALLEHGANVDFQDRDGITPLMAATGNLCPKNVRVLLEHGANPNRKDGSGGTALRYADAECAKLLIQNGADIHAIDDNGQTPLCALCMLGLDESAQMLIRQGADVNVKDKNGNTPLILASRKCRLDTVKMLLEHGADIQAKRNRGGNALYVAAGAGRSDLVTLYLDRGLDINIKTTTGSTPLMIAAQESQVDVVKTLLRRGADVNVRRTSGDTALSLAKQSKNAAQIQVVQMLQAAGAKEATTLSPGKLEGPGVSMGR
ncbi:MAG TPA: ankyrin repeat domain-containing protein [Chthonomonadaceae bacterium]|nr:ankyrin repeat domain-containing protein [Chthonomonadaceae bacterium]